MPTPDGNGEGGPETEPSGGVVDQEPPPSSEGARDTLPPQRLRAVGAGLSDVGLQREHNEDSYSLVPEHCLFIVADGMGGHRAGDVASRLAIEAVGDYFRRADEHDDAWASPASAQLSDEERRLSTSIRLANRRIYEHSVRSHEFRGMGTTVVGALFSPARGCMVLGHVGDSRVYRVRAGEIEQMTRDHSLVNDYLAAMPDMSAEQRSELPKNVITRALGMQDGVEVDVQTNECEPGDTYVLCSDGLSGMITDEEIRDVAVSTSDLDEICRRLVALANEHGGEDNITAVVVRVEEDGGARGASGRPAPEEEADTPPAGPAAG